MFQVTFVESEIFTIHRDLWKKSHCLMRVGHRRTTDMHKFSHSRHLGSWDIGDDFMLGRSNSWVFTALQIIRILHPTQKKEHNGHLSTHSPLTHIKYWHNLSIKDKHLSNTFTFPPPKNIIAVTQMSLAPEKNQVRYWAPRSWVTGSLGVQMLLPSCTHSTELTTTCSSKVNVIAS